MRSVKDETFECSPATQPEIDVSFADLASGLHALAQPLSGIRSAVELMNHISGQDAERYRRICATETERACEMFACLQGLIAIKTGEPKIRAFDCLNLVRTLISEQGWTGRFRPGFLAAREDDGRMFVEGDLERTRGAFASLLTVLVSICEGSEAIQASSTASGNHLVFNFSTTPMASRSLNSMNRLRLSLARASILNQRGQYNSQLDQLEIRVALPLAQQVHNQNTTQRMDP